MDSLDALAQAIFEAEDTQDDDAERFAARTLIALQTHGWDVVRSTR